MDYHDCWVYNGCLMGLLKKEQIDKVWEEHGMKWRALRLHASLLEMGLQPMAVPDYVFLRQIKEKLLDDFLVHGLKEEKH